MSRYWQSKFSDPDLRHCPVGSMHPSVKMPPKPSQGYDGTIPKIIHQSWKSNSPIPDDNKDSVDAWKNLHPDWQYILWDDDMNRELVVKEFPWLLRTYDTYTKEIFRADLSRALYMYAYGGVYADLDMEPLKPFDGLIPGKSVILGQMDTNNDWTYWHSIPNAIMAGAPGHPFWMLLVRIIMETTTEDYSPWAFLYSGRGTSLSNLYLNPSVCYYCYSLLLNHYTMIFLFHTHSS
jgi:mannosyltransferase OCH1-like enzyme